MSGKQTKMKWFARPKEKREKPQMPYGYTSLPENQTPQQGDLWYCSTANRWAPVAGSMLFHVAPCPVCHPIDVDPNKEGWRLVEFADESDLKGGDEYTTNGEKWTAFFGMAESNPPKTVSDAITRWCPEILAVRRKVEKDPECPNCYKSISACSCSPVGAYKRGEEPIGVNAETQNHSEQSCPTCRGEIPLWAFGCPTLSGYLHLLEKNLAPLRLWGGKRPQFLQDALRLWIQDGRPHAEWPGLADGKVEKEEKVDVPYGYRLVDKMKDAPKRCSDKMLTPLKVWTGVVASNEEFHADITYCRPIDVGEGWRLVGEDEAILDTDELQYISKAGFRTVSPGWIGTSVRAWNSSEKRHPSDVVLAVRRKAEKETCPHGNGAHVATCPHCFIDWSKKNAAKEEAFDCVCDDDVWNPACRVHKGGIDIRSELLAHKEALKPEPTPPAGYRLIDPEKDGPKRGGDLMWSCNERWVATESGFVPSYFYARKIEEPNHIGDTNEMAGRWVKVSERLPIDDRLYLVQLSDGRITLFVAEAVRGSANLVYPVTAWLDYPPAPPIEPEQSAEGEARDTAVGHVIKYLAQQFPATVGHLAILEKLEGVFNAGVELGRKSK